MVQPVVRRQRRPLTPEEDAIGDPEGEDEIDDTLPADLWFRSDRRIRHRVVPAPRRILPRRDAD